MPKKVIIFGAMLALFATATCYWVFKPPTKTIDYAQRIGNKSATLDLPTLGPIAIRGGKIASQPEKALFSMGPYVTESTLVLNGALLIDKENSEGNRFSFLKVAITRAGEPFYARAFARQSCILESIEESDDVSKLGFVCEIKMPKLSGEYRLSVSEVARENLDRMDCQLLAMSEFTVVESIPPKSK